jgi:hypothetical protein
MQPDLELAFCAAEPASRGVVVLVNFGIVTGRAATPAEIDELARMLRPEVEDVSIVSEERHEIGGSAEASIHQVRLEVDDAGVPADETRDGFCDRLVEIATFWARMCAHDRHSELADL